MVGSDSPAASADSLSRPRKAAAAAAAEGEACSGGRDGDDDECFALVSKFGPKYYHGPRSCSSFGLGLERPVLGLKRTQFLRESTSRETSKEMFSRDEYSLLRNKIKDYLETISL